MGGALVRGLAAFGRFRLIICEPDPSPAIRALARAGKIVLNPASEVMGRARLAVIAVKPQMLAGVIAPLKPILARMPVLSIAAGVRIATLRKLCGTRRVIRAMPNLPVEARKGISAVFAPAPVSAAERKLAALVLDAGGKVVFLEDEKLLDAVTAVSGSGPAYVFHLVEALAAAAMSEGLSGTLARTLARETVIGAAALLASGADPAVLRAQVTSPGGTTEAGLSVLMGKGGLMPLIRQTVAAARKRAKMLGQ